jgi:hypothetical protein
MDQQTFRESFIKILSIYVVPVTAVFVIVFSCLLDPGKKRMLFLFD